MDKVEKEVKPIWERVKKYVSLADFIDLDPEQIKQKLKDEMDEVRPSEGKQGDFKRVSSAFSQIAVKDQAILNEIQRQRIEIKTFKTKYGKEQKRPVFIKGTKLAGVSVGGRFAKRID